VLPSHQHHPPHHSVTVARLIRLPLSTRATIVVLAVADDEQHYSTIPRPLPSIFLA